MANKFVKARKQTIEGFTEVEEGKWVEPYSFVFIGDPQLGSIDKEGDGDGSRWDVEVARTRVAVEAVNKMQPIPKFVMIGGDMVNAFPGDPLRPEQVSDLKDAFSGLNCKIPILLTIGNHDTGDFPTTDSMEICRKDFGEEFYSYWVGGVFYIVMNTQCYIDVNDLQDLCDTHEKWLQEELKRARSSLCQHVVLFMHIPLFVDNPAEKDNFFSIPSKKRHVLLEQFADAGIEKVFSGHVHKNAGGVWKKKRDDGSEVEIEMIASTALGLQIGKDQPGLRVVRVLEKEIIHEYYALPDIPHSINLL